MLGSCFVETGTRAGMLSEGERSCGRWNSVDVERETGKSVSFLHASFDHEAMEGGIRNVQ